MLRGATGDIGDSYVMSRIFGTMKHTHDRTTAALWLCLGDSPGPVSQASGRWS